MAVVKTSSKSENSSHIRIVPDPEGSENAPYNRFVYDMDVGGIIIDSSGGHGPDINLLDE